MKLMPGATIEIGGRTYTHKGDGFFTESTKETMLGKGPWHPGDVRTVNGIQYKYENGGFTVLSQSRVDAAREMLKRINDLKAERESLVTAVSNWDQTLGMYEDAMTESEELPQDVAAVAALTRYIGQYEKAKYIVDQGDSHKEEGE